MKRPEPGIVRLQRRFKGWLREQMKVEIILPAIIALGLLAYVASIAAASKHVGEIWTILEKTWYIVLLLTLPYLLARALVWHELLKDLGLDIPWRQLMIAFAGGEMTKSLPAGAYTQNYLLGKLEHFGRVPLIRSTMATTAMLGLETLLALPVALIVGIPGQPWLFWTLLGIVGVWVIIVVVAWVLVHHFAAHTNPRSHRWLAKGAQIASDFLEAAADLVSVRTLRSLPPTAVYMLVYVVDLVVIMRAIGVDNVSFVHAMAIYAVIVLAVVLIPIPTELGITELTGLGALAAYGVPASTAAVIMIGLRILASGMTILVAGIVFLLMRGELRAVRQEERGSEARGGATAGE